MTHASRMDRRRELSRWLRSNEKEIRGVNYKYDPVVMPSGKLVGMYTCMLYWDPLVAGSRCSTLAMSGRTMNEATIKAVEWLKKEGRL